MDSKVKSGKEILEDFFVNISKIDRVDKSLAESIAALYKQNRLTDTNMKNELQNLRNRDANKN